MQSSSSFSSRAAWGLLGIVMLSVGCAASQGAAATAPTQLALAPEILRVEGHVVQVGGRQVAYIEAFPSPQAPVMGAPVQLQVSTTPAAQLSAVVTHVEPRLDGWLEVEADLVQSDAHIATATPFTGQILLRGR